MSCYGVMAERDASRVLPPGTGTLDVRYSVMISLIVEYL